MNTVKISQHHVKLKTIIRVVQKSKFLESVRQAYFVKYEDTKLQRYSRMLQIFE